MKNFKFDRKGITLIALVITIIVLLILAGVTIATLMGDNGILTKATESNLQTQIGEEKEYITLSMSAIRGNKILKENTSEITSSELQIEMNKYTEEATVTGRGTLTVTYKSGRKYEVKQDGSIRQKEEGELPEKEGTKPYLPSDDFSQVEGTDLDTGLVIEDLSGNQWVWIEVPNSGINAVNYESFGATDNTKVTEIENALHEYTSAYRDEENYDDIWINNSNGIKDSSEYNLLKNRMLASIYDNGGFYIGRYEAGSDIPRDSKTETLTNAVVKANQYPYNNLRGKEAQELASNLEAGNRTTSLMFGVQWDLVLKYLENHGVSSEELKDDSGTWGNYRWYSEFEVTNTEASWSGFVDGEKVWEKITGVYTKEESRSILLTTGATDRNSRRNIYDLAGNVYEYTLESSLEGGYTCTCRGGNYDGSYGHTANSRRTEILSTYSGDYIGFRPAMY